MTMNPWRLNDREQSTMAVIIRVGKLKQAGRELGVTHKVMEAQSQSIRRKMGVSSLVTAAVMFDRFERGGVVL